MWKENLLLRRALRAFVFSPLSGGDVGTRVQGNEPSSALGSRDNVRKKSYDEGKSSVLCAVILRTHERARVVYKSEYAVRLCMHVKIRPVRWLACVCVCVCVYVIRINKRVTLKTSVLSPEIRIFENASDSEGFCRAPTTTYRKTRVEPIPPPLELILLEIFSREKKRWRDNVGDYDGARVPIWNRIIL